MKIALGAAGLGWLVLLLPLLAVIVHSLSAGPAGYAGILQEPRLLSGLGTSLLLGVATGGALLIGIPAALGLARSTLPGRRALLALLISPLGLPGLVLGFGLLTGAALLTRAAGIPLAGTLPPLVAAHLLIAIPWIARSVAVSLESADPALEEQARSLGAGPFATLFLVTLPSARAGIASGAVSAFAVSFGTFSLSLPLASGRTVTLPVAIYDSVDRGPDPTTAAVGALTIAIAVAAAAPIQPISGGAKRR